MNDVALLKNVSGVGKLRQLYHFHEERNFYMKRTFWEGKMLDKIARKLVKIVYRAENQNQVRGK